MKTKFILLSTLLTIVAACSYDSDSNYSSDAIYIDEYNSSVTSGENYKEYLENPFVVTSEQAISTFSVDADGGSYANTRRFLHLGQTPPKASVRIEEYLNYFTFDYNEPSGNDHVALNSEISECPWNNEHHLLRLGMKGKTIPLEQLPNSNYVFLIDVSGSMNTSDKLGILKAGFKNMVDNLRENDRVAIVTYAGQAGLLLASTQATEKDKIKAAIDALGAGGATAGAAGIHTAYEIAEEYFIEDGNNRIILGSDGDFNVGISNTDQLIALVEEKRESGIYLSVLGVGQGNLNDHMMEQIANNGNGNYEYIDSAQEIQKIFTYDLSKFYTVAKDSKIQLEFNPNRVASYRLIGYENRVLNEEDFEDDTKDAGEIGSGQTITALYELILSDTAVDEEFASFDFRYKKNNEETTNLLQLTINNPIQTIENASENIRFASALASLGLILSESEYKGNANKQMVLDLSNTISYDPNGLKQDFTNLIENWNP